MAKPKAQGPSKSNGATLGFEQKLWQPPGKLRNNLDACSGSTHPAADLESTAWD